MKKRILFIVNAEWYFKLHWLPLAIGLKNSGYEVLIAASEERGEGSAFEQVGIKFFRLPFQRQSFNPFYEFWSLIKIIVLLREVRPEIVHNITIKPVIIGTFAAQLVNIPNIINTITGLGFTFLKQGFLGSALRSSMLFIYRLMFLKNNVFVSFQNIDDKKLIMPKVRARINRSIVINGVGVITSKFKQHPIPENDNIVILASRLLWDKGVGEFVKAAIYLKSIKSKVRMVLVGMPDEMNPASISNQELSEWCNENYVEWWGHQDNMPEIINKASIVVLPSYREGLPTILIEAASVGRPLIATDVPGCREVVNNGINGYLVPIKDHIALAETINKMINNYSLMKRMGTNSRRIALNKFDIKIILQQHIKLYNSILN